MEATGGYETDPAAELQTAELPAAAVNPGRIRDFAKAPGQTAKTDKIDARVIAGFGAALQPPASETVDETTRKIKVLTVRKRQLTGIRTAEKNRTEHIRDDFIEESIRTVISAIEEQICGVEGQNRILIASSSDLKQKTGIIQSFRGIGESAASGLTSGLPEIGTLNRGQIASLAGTAPVNRDSGQFRGKRMSGGGRCEIRTLLYMPTPVAIQHNPVIRDFYNRLIKKGKNKMVAAVACMRNILVILNSMVKNNQSWEPKTA